MSSQQEPLNNVSAKSAPTTRNFNQAEFDSIDDPLIGQTLADKYKIISLLGRGGMSSVYQAEHTLMKRMLALKVLFSHLATDQNSLKRFQQEAWIAGTFSHPNVVQVHDFGMEPNGQVYLVMDLVDGRSLQDELEVVGRLSYERAIDIFIQVASGLAAAHHVGVLHRDMKPSNIMLSDGPDGNDFARIVDFGIAKVLDGEDSLQRLTQTGEVFGSPLYMSPEQCQGKTLDKRSDIYSLGTVLYESLVGRPAHMGKTAMDTMRLHITEIPRPFGEVAPHVEIPARLEEIVFRMLEKNPADRYDDLNDFIDDIQKLKSSSTNANPSLSGRVAMVKREFARRHRIISKMVTWGLIAALLLAFAASYAYPTFVKYGWQKNMYSAQVFFDRGKLKDAEQSAIKAMEWAEKTNDDEMTQSKTLELLARIYKRQGNYLGMQEARLKQQRIIQNELTQNYGVSNSELERMAEAALAEAPEPMKHGGDPETYEQVIYRLNAAAALCNQHNHNAFAEKLIKKAIELRESASGKNAAALPAMYGLLAATCVQQQKFKEAEKYFAKQLEVARVCGGKEKSGLILAECNMVRVYTAKGQIAEGEALAKEALSLAESECGSNGDLVKTCLEDYAALLRAAGRDAEAAPMEKRAAAIN